jgi:hypothetical protein
MDDQEESQNVEDERGAGGFQLRPVHGIGIGTLTVVLIGGWLLGINPLRMLGVLSGSGDGQIETIIESPTWNPGSPN